MSLIKIWIHLVWSTKYRDPIITKKLKPKLLEHIKNNAREKGYFIDEINCTYDHIHLLIALGSRQNISDFVRLIKGESSHWVNSINLITPKFHWQYDYFAVSLAPREVNKIRNYIRNQENHHRNEYLNKDYNRFNV